MKKLIHTLVISVVFVLAAMPVKAEVSINYNYGVVKNPPNVLLVACSGDLDSGNWCEKKLKSEIEKTGTKVILWGDVFKDNVKYTNKQRDELLAPYNIEHKLFIYDSKAPEFIPGSSKAPSYSQTTVSGGVGGVPVTGSISNYTPGLVDFAMHKLDMDIHYYDQNHSMIIVGKAVTYASSLRKHYYKIALDLVKQLKRDGFLWNGKKR